MVNAVGERWHKTRLKCQESVQPTTNYFWKARKQKSEFRVFLRALVRSQGHGRYTGVPSRLSSTQIPASIYASRYRCDVFDGRRVGTAFDTFLGYLRRGLTREDLWLAVLIRHPTATQSELEIAAAASADVIRDEKRRRDAAAI